MDLTFDLEESLHAESVLKRRESLVNVCQPHGWLKTVNKIEKEKRQKFVVSETDRHDEYNERS